MHVFNIISWIFWVSNRRVNFWKKSKNVNKGAVAKNNTEQILQCLCFDVDKDSTVDLVDENILVDDKADVFSSWK